MTWGWDDNASKRNLIPAENQHMHDQAHIIVLLLLIMHVPYSDSNEIP